MHPDNFSFDLLFLDTVESAAATACESPGRETSMGTDEARRIVKWGILVFLVSTLVGVLVLQVWGV